jgi:hypothetical protein
MRAEWEDDHYLTFRIAQKARHVKHIVAACRWLNAGNQPLGALPAQTGTQAVHAQSA